MHPVVMLPYFLPDLSQKQLLTLLPLADLLPHLLIILSDTPLLLGLPVPVVQHRQRGLVVELGVRPLLLILHVLESAAQGPVLD